MQLSHTWGICSYAQKVSTYVRFWCPFGFQFLVIVEPFMVLMSFFIKIIGIVHSLQNSLCGVFFCYVILMCRYMQISVKKVTLKKTSRHKVFWTNTISSSRHKLFPSYILQKRVVKHYWHYVVCHKLRLYSGRVSSMTVICVDLFYSTV